MKQAGTGYLGVFQTSIKSTQMEELPMFARTCKP